MVSIRDVEDLVPETTVTTYVGQMVQVNADLKVNVNGNLLEARWADPLVVVAGDPVLVDISSSRKGSGRAFVRCRLASGPRPASGTVATVPASSPTITVTGTDGVTYSATFIGSYNPVVGDKVILSWNAAVPSVMGKITTTPAPPPAAAPPPPVAAPPPPPATGTETYQAGSSDTIWGPGGWGSWAGGNSNVYQGNYGSGPVYGAWFYHGSPKQLAGRNITRIRFLLGSRRPVGSNNSPVTVHFYAHNSTFKPGGDVARVVGPHDVTANPGQGLTQYDLPLSFAATLLAGGGIAIAGDPYCGFLGINSQPESGLLLLDWSA